MVRASSRARALRMILRVMALGILLAAWSLFSFPQGAVPAGRGPATLKYLVGVDYFPAFHYNAWRFGDEWLPLRLAEPWVAKDEIQPRRPLAYLGYYDDTQPSTWDRQIALANKYGVSFFFIQYPLVKGVPMLGQDKVLDALLASTEAQRIRFAVNWLDDSESDFSRTHLTNFLDHIEKYFRSPSYLRIDGKPVVGLLHWHNIGVNLKSRIRDMQLWAKGKGYPGLYFIASSVSPGYGDHLGASEASEAGIDAVTCLAVPLAGTAYGDPWPEGMTAPYATMTGALKQMWEDAYVPSGAAVFPFPNSGWDDSAWGGTKAFVRTGSTASEFSKQLAAAKEFLDRKKITPRIVLIASWNEWGEGHFIEPCEPFGYSYLEAVGKTFNGIDEKVALPADLLPPEDVATPRVLVFDDFVSDGRSWIGYVGDPKACIDDGHCEIASYYGYVAGLRVRNLEADGTLSDGVFSCETTGPDPSFAKLAIGLDGDVYDTLEIRYRIGAGSGVPAHPDLIVWWTNEQDRPPVYGAFGYFNFGGCPGDPFCCTQAYWGALAADGEWHTLRVKFDTPTWRGTIWSVRINFLRDAPAGTPVDVDYVHFLKGSG